jgi:hypothetical protein
VAGPTKPRSDAVLHFVGILNPPDDLPPGDDRQKPFFGPEWRLTRTERDAAVLDGKWPAPADEPRDPAEGMRFVSLLSPPFI